MTISISVQPFEREHSFALISFLCHLLPTFGIQEVEIMYGWYWKNQDFTWKYKKIFVDNLLSEITEIEDQGFGKIGDDDLYIKIEGHHLEIILCHENDIHVDFETMAPLVEEIYHYLSTAFLKTGGEKHPFTSPVFFSEKPTFIVSSELSPTELQQTQLYLQDWDQFVDFPPNKSVNISAYGTQPGLMEIQKEGNQINIRSWTSSNILIHCDKQLLIDTAKLILK